MDTAASGDAHAAVPTQSPAALAESAAAAASQTAAEALDSSPSQLGGQVRVSGSGMLRNASRRESNTSSGADAPSSPPVATTRVSRMGASSMSGTPQHALTRDTSRRDATSMGDAASLVQKPATESTAATSTVPGADTEGTACQSQGTGGAGEESGQQQQHGSSGRQLPGPPLPASGGLPPRNSRTLKQAMSVLPASSAAAAASWAPPASRLSHPGTGVGMSGSISTVGVSPLDAGLPLGRVQGGADGGAALEAQQSATMPGNTALGTRASQSLEPVQGAGGPASEPASGAVQAAGLQQAASVPQGDAIPADAAGAPAAGATAAVEASGTASHPAQVPVSSTTAPEPQPSAATTSTPSQAATAPDATTATITITATGASSSGGGGGGGGYVPPVRSYIPGTLGQMQQPDGVRTSTGGGAISSHRNMSGAGAATMSPPGSSAPSFGGAPPAFQGVSGSGGSFSGGGISWGPGVGDRQASSSQLGSGGVSMRVRGTLSRGPSGVNASGLMRQRTLKPKELVSKFFWQHYEKYEMRLHKIKMAELAKLQAVKNRTLGNQDVEAMEYGFMSHNHDVHVREVMAAERARQDALPTHLEVQGPSKFHAWLARLPREEAAAIVIQRWWRAWLEFRKIAWPELYDKPLPKVEKEAAYVWSSSSSEGEQQPRRASVTQQQQRLWVEKKKKPGNRAGFGTSAAKPMNAEARRRASEVGERAGVTTPGSTASGTPMDSRRSASLSGTSRSGNLIWSTAAAPKPKRRGDANLNQGARYLQGIPVGAGHHHKEPLQAPAEDPAAEEALLAAERGDQASISGTPDSPLQVGRDSDSGPGPYSTMGTELASLKEEEGGGGWGVADADAEDEEEEGDDAVWGMGTGLLGPARKFQPGTAPAGDGLWAGTNEFSRGIATAGTATTGLYTAGSISGQHLEPEFEAYLSRPQGSAVTLKSPPMRAGGVGGFGNSAVGRVDAWALFGAPSSSQAGQTRTPALVGTPVLGHLKFWGGARTRPQHNPKEVTDPRFFAPHLGQVHLQETQQEMYAGSMRIKAVTQVQVPHPSTRHPHSPHHHPAGPGPSGREAGASPSSHGHGGEESDSAHEGLRLPHVGKRHAAKGHAKHRRGHKHGPGTGSGTGPESGPEDFGSPLHGQPSAGALGRRVVNAHPASHQQHHQPHTSHHPHHTSHPHTSHSSTSSPWGPSLRNTPAAISALHASYVAAQQQTPPEQRGVLAPRTQHHHHHPHPMKQRRPHTVGAALGGGVVKGQGGDSSLSPGLEAVSSNLDQLLVTRASHTLLAPGGSVPGPGSHAVLKRLSAGATLATGTLSPRAGARTAAAALGTGPLSGGTLLLPPRPSPSAASPGVGAMPAGHPYQHSGLVGARRSRSLSPPGGRAAGDAEGWAPAVTGGAAAAGAMTAGSGSMDPAGHISQGAPHPAGATHPPHLGPQPSSASLQSYESQQAALRRVAQASVGNRTPAVLPVHLLGGFGRQGHSAAPASASHYPQVPLGMYGAAGVHQEASSGGPLAAQPSSSAVTAALTGDPSWISLPQQQGPGQSPEGAGSVHPGFTGWEDSSGMGMVGALKGGTHRPGTSVTLHPSSMYGSFSPLASAAGQQARGGNAGHGGVHNARPPAAAPLATGTTAVPLVSGEQQQQGSTLAAQASGILAQASFPSAGAAPQPGAMGQSSFPATTAASTPAAAPAAASKPSRTSPAAGANRSPGGRRGQKEGRDSGSPPRPDRGASSGAATGGGPTAPASGGAAGPSSTSPASQPPGLPRGPRPRPSVPAPHASTVAVQGAAVGAGTAGAAGGPGTTTGSHAISTSGQGVDPALLEPYKGAPLLSEIKRTAGTATAAAAPAASGLAPKSGPTALPLLLGAIQAEAEVAAGNTQRGAAAAAGALNSPRAAQQQKPNISPRGLPKDGADMGPWTTHSTSGAVAMEAYLQAAVAAAAAGLPQAEAMANYAAANTKQGAAGGTNTSSKIGQAAAGPPATASATTGAANAMAQQPQQQQLAQVAPLPIQQHLPVQYQALHEEQYLASLGRQQQHQPGYSGLEQPFWQQQQQQGAKSASPPALSPAVLAAQLQQQLQAYAATGAGTHATPFAGATHSPPASAGWLTAENSAAAGPLYAGAHHSHPGQGQGDRSGSPPPPHLAASLQPSNARTAGKAPRPARLMVGRALSVPPEPVLPHAGAPFLPQQQPPVMPPPRTPAMTMTITATGH